MEETPVEESDRFSAPVDPRWFGGLLPLFKGRSERDRRAAAAAAAAAAAV